jgi:hypothetical protein
MDVQEVCGHQQLCTGLKAGIEGAVHAMMDIFKENSSKEWGVLLVDASNAFNSVNRVSALLSARKNWPRCSRFLFNTYRGHSVLKLQNTNELLFSKEGVTQGDPLSMMMYGLAVLPLIHSLAILHSQNVIQNWYADDAAATGELSAIKEWLKSLMHQGPNYGYYPEPTKSFLVVAPQFEEKAKILFSDIGVQIVTGQRFLGGYIGCDTGKALYMEKKVKHWNGCIEKLTEIAKSQPQAAFSALTKSLQCEWNYYQRVIPDCESFFQPLETALKEKFIPAVFDGEIGDHERKLFSLPARMGGIGVRDPVSTAAIAHATSRNATEILATAIHTQSSFNAVEHTQRLQNVRKQYTEVQRTKDKEALNQLLSAYDPPTIRSITRIVEEKTSHWLTVLPIARNHFDLSCSEFRDALSIRYRRALRRSPGTCDGCGVSFSLSHALSCKKGGLIIQRHNEIRDAIGDLSALAWKEVVSEPVIREREDFTNTPALIADLGVRGVWAPQTMALFDIRVTDTDAPSYSTHSIQSVLSNAETAKKTKYAEACQQRRASFTPLIVSVDGALGTEAKAFIKRLSGLLATKWEKNQATTLTWIRTRLSFSILRATHQCIRGSRIKWRSLGGDDGAFIKTALFS